VERARSFPAQQGARPDEISLNPISTETVTTDAGEVIAYKLTRSFEVRSDRVSAVAQLVEKSQELLAQGVPLQAQQPQYVYRT
jgi:hypothetical protein